MREGDVITKVNGRHVYLWDEISLYNILNMDGEKMEITYERGGAETTVVLEPRMLGDDAYPRLGITGEGERERPGILGTMQYALYTVRYWVNYTFESLKMLVTGKVGIQQMSGPVGIVNMVDETYQQSIAINIQTTVLSMMTLAILVTANLGIMNLLPIPALDGGRLVFLAIEAVRGKRVPPDKEGMVHFVGLAALMVLMVVVLFNDVMRLF